MTKRVRVVIVTFNAADIIRDCLVSLYSDFTAGLIEVSVVDNDSSDKTTEIVKHEFEWVSLIDAGRNAGFGAGNNLGSNGFQGDYLYFLNSDARSMPESIDRLVGTLDEDNKIGIVGPLIYDEAGNKTLSSYRFVTPFYAVWIAVGLNKVFPLNRSNGKSEIRRVPPDGLTRVDRLLGAAFMMRRDLFVKFGGFDENYFLFSEEEDLCMQTHKAGFETVFDPDAKAIHLGSKTIVQYSTLGIASASWSLVYFLKKHFNNISANMAIFAWEVMLGVKWLIVFLFVRNGKIVRMKGYSTAIKSLINSTYYDNYVRPK